MELVVIDKAELKELITSCFSNLLDSLPANNSLGNIEATFPEKLLNSKELWAEP